MADWQCFCTTVNKADAQGVLGLRLAAARHPASGGGAARARARAPALPVAAAAAVGACQAQARRAPSPRPGAARRAPPAIAGAAAARDADATQKEAAHRLNWFRRRVAAEEAAHGRSVATR